VSTIRQQILDEILDLLNFGRPSDVPLATSRRWLLGDDVDLPAISVWVIEETRRRGQRSARFGGPDERTLKVAIQVVYAGEHNASAERQIDEYIEHVDDVLGDTTITDLAHQVVVDRITWEVVQQDVTYVVATAECLIQYQTTRGDSSLNQ